MQVGYLQLAGTCARHVEVTEVPALLSTVDPAALGMQVKSMPWGSTRCTPNQLWAREYCARRDAIYLAYAIHRFGRMTARWLLS